MKRFTSLTLSIFIAFCLVVASERRAWGYVDPGSGLIALQTVASVAAAYAYIVRRRIRDLFTSKSKKPVQSVSVLPVAAKPADSREVA